MKFESIESFKEKYVSFQKRHTLITIVFLAILAFQAILFFVTSIGEIFQGYQTGIFIGTEIAVYLIITKFHEKISTLKCPKCNKILSYKYGLEVINSRQCPHCSTCIINNE
ncbi:MAG: hypothetical protein ABIK92_13970 [Pseudomonadota bacterium]